MDAEFKSTKRFIPPLGIFLKMAKIGYFALKV